MKSYDDLLDEIIGLAICIMIEPELRCLKWYLVAFWDSYMELRCYEEMRLWELN